MSKNVIKLHIENDSSLGEVFEVTPAKIAAALERSPDMAGKFDWTIGYDCAQFDFQIADADALICWDIDTVNLAHRAPRLRWIHATGAGVEHFAPFDWLPDGATFTNNAGIHGERADEYAIMSLLMLNNRVPEMVTNQRAARWEQTFNSSINGKTLLVVGVGHVGGGVATWAKRFGMTVLGVRRSGEEHPAIDEMHRPDAIPSLISRADFIFVATPATANTRHLIGATEISAMRPGTGIVSYSRAAVIDYEAIRIRCEANDISAILDVFDPEPLPADSPLWHTPNIIITPHCSSDDTDVYIPKTLDHVLANMRRFRAGNPLENRVDPVLEY
ncbi:MAG: D-2-hydroxyacid dehydrogenase [Rhodospirillaceae bacterium]|nr:D-2-hydroxyacid dehydrogenase [Rhodospirillaceae bacterium]